MAACDYKITAGTVQRARRQGWWYRSVMDGKSVDQASCVLLVLVLVRLRLSLLPPPGKRPRYRGETEYSIRW